MQKPILPSDPMKDLEQRLSSPQLSTEDVGYAVDMVLAMAGIPVSARQAVHRNAVIQAELEARQKQRALIREAMVAETFTELMRRIGAPAWAGVTLAEVQQLRRGLLHIVPHMVANDQGVLAEGLYIIESLYIMQLLGRNGRLIRDESFEKERTKSTSQTSSTFRLADSKSIEFRVFKDRYLESNPQFGLGVLEEFVLRSFRIITA